MRYRYGSGMGGLGFALMTISLVLFAGLVIAGVAACPPSLRMATGR